MKTRLVILLFFSLVSSSEALLYSLPSSSSKKLLLQQQRPQRFRLDYSKRNENSGDSFDADLLQERLRNLRLEIMEEEMRRPPNSNVSPVQLIEEVMKGLLNPYDPTPYSGFRLMIRTATQKWRKKILDSVGATNESDIEIVAAALKTAIGRPHNQFAILVGKGEQYSLDISDPTNFHDDGTCWVECRLRDKESDELLVITGWELRKENGVWLVHRIDWQDFRDEVCNFVCVCASLFLFIFLLVDKALMFLSVPLLFLFQFRPGIGREEWMREYP